MPLVYLLNVYLKNNCEVVRMIVALLIIIFVLIFSLVYCIFYIFNQRKLYREKINYKNNEINKLLKENS